MATPLKRTPRQYTSQKTPFETPPCDSNQRLIMHAFRGQKSPINQHHLLPSKLLEFKLELKFKLAAKNAKFGPRWPQMAKKRSQKPGAGRI